MGFRAKRAYLVLGRAVGALRGLVAVLALVALLPGSAAAQDAVGAGVEYIAPARLVDLVGSSQDPALALFKMHATVLYPIKLDAERTMLIVGLGYAGAVPRADNARSDLVDTFHEFGPKVGVVQRVGASWTLAAQLLPQLATNFEDISADHMRYGGLVLADYRVDADLSLGGALLVTYVFGEQIYLPGAKVRWRVMEGVRLDAFLPAKLRLGVQVAPSVELGVKGRLVGNRYNVKSAVNANVEQLIFTQLDASAFVAVRLRAPLWLSVWSGYTVYRNLELRDGAGETLIDLNTSNAPVIGLNVLVRGPSP